MERDQQVGWGLLAAGLLGLVAFYAFLPDVKTVAYCDESAGSLTLGSNQWLTFHDPQLGDGMIRYEPENGTTLVVPGCGHGTLYAAIRLRGDHSTLREPFRLLVAPTGPFDGSTEPIDPPFSTYRQPVDRAFATEFETKTLSWHLAIFTTSLAAAGAGIAILARKIPPPFSWGPAAGLLLGAFFGITLARAGGLGGYILGLLLVVVFALVGAGILLFAKERPRLEGAAWLFVAVSVAIVLAAFGFVEAFPSYPEA